MDHLSSSHTALNSQISRKERTRLISAIELFNHLTNEQRDELLDLFVEKNYKHNQLIIKENDPVNSIDIIASGSVKVMKGNIHNNKNLITVLQSGECIGLAVGGFFSKTAKRTASLVAEGEVWLLSLKLTALAEFMAKFSDLEISKNLSDDIIMRIDFLTILLPHLQFDHDKLSRLAQKIESLSFESGTVIFNEGDASETCYFIRSGTVNIFKKNPDGTHNILADLTRYDLFGELGSLSGGVRNASAQAATRCQVYAVSGSQLMAFLEKDPAYTRHMLNLFRERMKLQQQTNVKIYEKINKEGVKHYILKGTNNNYCKLSREGLFVWEQIDGVNTLKDITINFFSKFHIFSPEAVYNIINLLMVSGFLDVPHESIDRRLVAKQTPMWIRALTTFRKLMEFQYQFNNFDKKIQMLFDIVGYIFFNPISYVLMTIIACSGLFSFLYISPHAISSLRHHIISGHILLPVVLLLYLASINHELAHALTVKHYKREIHKFGVGWMWFSPVILTNTSDMWLSDKWDRIGVNIAGMISDSVLAGASALLAWFLIDSHVFIYLWLYTLISYLKIFSNLNPGIPLDGYYVLMDYFEKSNLRESAVNWLILCLEKNPATPRFSAKYKPEITYWIASLFFLIMLNGVAFIVQNNIFVLLGYAPRTYMAIILPLLSTVLYIFAIVGEVKNKRYKMGKSP